MSLWWPAAITTGHYASQPWNKWFYDYIVSSAWGWPGYDFVAISKTYYYFKKISAGNGHKIQLAIKSPIDRQCDWYVASTGKTVTYKVKKNVIYICCYSDDTPNWGSVSKFVTVSPPCSNWHTHLYEVIEKTTRSQTWGLLAGIATTRDKALSVSAAVAKTGSLEGGLSAAIAADIDLPISIYAAILGDANQYCNQRAAIRTDRLLEPSALAAVAQDFDLPIDMYAAIQGNPEAHSHVKAAILGETESSVGIVAYVVKSRVDEIMLEMENLWPQDLDLRSTPNRASKFKDWRKSSLGE